jgi:hypothetical protein
MPPSLKHYADYFSMGLEMGLCSQAGIAAWADRLIEQDDRPPDWAIELATSTSKHLVDVVHLLNVVPGARNPEISLRLLIAKLGMVHPILLPDNDRFAQPEHSRLLNLLCRLVSPWEDFPNDIVGRVYGIDCDLDCVEQGYGDWSIIEQSYADLLAIASDYGQYLPID